MILTPMLKSPPVGPRIEFWTPVNKTTESVIVLSTHVRAHFIHFDGRSYPCLEETNEHGEVLKECERCANPRMPKRWRGYLHVLRLGHMACEFLCLPPGTGAQLELRNGVDFNYRGLVAGVWRQGGNKNKPLIVEVNPHAKRREDLPEELDPSPYLDVVFRLRKHLP